MIGIVRAGLCGYVIRLDMKRGCSDKLLEVEMNFGIGCYNYWRGCYVCYS